jgi:AraC-like DNA-binding protein
MIRIDKEKINNVAKYLEKIKIFTIDQLASSLNCSTPSARLKIKQYKAYTSYNHNGRYYTMPCVPRFDKNGLWHYKGIRFSKHGTLKNTVVHLVNNAQAGLTGKQIGDIVGISPRSFLHHFRDTTGISREKHVGVYVYFSDNADVYKHQLQKISATFTEAAEDVSEVDAIVILVALIKGHSLCVEDIIALPDVRAQKISSFSIGKFMENHGLIKKTTGTEH